MQPHALDIFYEMASACRKGKRMRPRSANDKEYFAQDWFIDRLKTLKVEFVQQGRNSYPDFWVGAEGGREGFARTPEKGNYNPRELTVPAGEKAKLRIRNVDTVTHGFAIPSLGLDAGEIKAGHVAILEFTPERPGTYEFYCTTWCGDHHLQMHGKLIVK